ncbi:hypothetical protein MNBD_GAMMA17-955 [hydrothermal vent metagenome]|uniref:Uncharacterized protein n=1 Tax=hydrothermal vent metagenome TaxID=652676 RepID=A0A3B0YXB7_9ZZZZ
MVAECQLNEGGSGYFAAYVLNLLRGFNLL